MNNLTQILELPKKLQSKLFKEQSNSDTGIAKLAAFTLWLLKKFGSQ